MVNGKLILICQSGGSFVTNADGSLSYVGGDANAVNITQETDFDHLKLNLAEVCDFDFNSVLVKYFLPGNNRTLINLKSDRDLRRMLEFHASSVTAGVFVSGNPGFDRSFICLFRNREPGVKLPETVISNDSHAEPVSVDNYFEVDIHYATHPLAGAGKTKKNKSAGRKVLSVPLADSLVDVKEDNSLSELSAHGSGEKWDYSPESRAKSGSKAESDVAVDNYFEVAIHYATQPLAGAGKKLLSVPLADSLVDVKEDNSLSELSAHGSGEKWDYSPESRAKSGSKAESDVAVDNYFEVAIHYATQPLAGAGKTKKNKSAGRKLLSVPLADSLVDVKEDNSLSELSAHGSGEKWDYSPESRAKSGSKAENDVAVDNYFEVDIHYATQPLAGAGKTKKNKSAGRKLLSVPLTDSLVDVKEDNSLSELSAHGSGEEWDYSPDSRAKSGSKAESDVDFVDCTTPAERVKKRRRTAGSNKAEVASGRRIASNKNTDDGDLTNVVVVEEMEEGSEFVMVADEDLNGDADLPEKLVASWKKDITGVGQNFRSVKEFREALQKYAIANRFMYRFKKNDTNRASGRCLIEGCSWRVHATWVHVDQTFRIRKFNDEHTCGGESWKSAHPGRNWLVSIIKEKIRDSPNEKPREVAKAILCDFGIKLKYSQVWRGIKDAKKQLQGSYMKSYNQLPWFCEKLLETNPGSVSRLVIGEQKRFERLFFSLRAALNGFKNGCRPLILLEASSLRSKYKETLLTANAVDADEGLFPVAFAIVDIENDDSWRWFLVQLKSAISTLQPLTFISDREKNLQNCVLDLFENAYHGYSIFHLIESLKKNMKGPFQGDGRGVIPSIFLAAAHAVRLESFKSFTEKIKQISSSTYDWVIHIDPAHWTTVLFKGVPYNHITHNPTEEYSKLIDDMQGSTVLQKIEALICMLSNKMNHRREVSSNCSTKLAPSKQKQLLEKSTKARGLNVLFSSEVVFEVHDDLTHVVNIENLHCTCLEWKPSGLPCCHAVAVFLSSSKSVYNYCPHWFTIESFRAAYSESISPIPGIGRPVEDEVDSESPDVLPPLPRVPVHEKEEVTKTIDPNKRTVICSKCKEPGHNKASCKAYL